MAASLPSHASAIAVGEALEQLSAPADHLEGFFVYFLYIEIEIFSGLLFASKSRNRCPVLTHSRLQIGCGISFLMTNKLSKNKNKAKYCIKGRERCSQSREGLQLEPQML